MNGELTVQTAGPGLYEFTAEVEGLVSGSRIEDGLCTLFVRHTSASLVIQENADPSARRDLERWLEELLRQIDFKYSHTSEGADDMPSHIKSALTAVSLSIPVARGRLALGTWQGIYLWEHRQGGHRRRIAVHIGGGG